MARIANKHGLTNKYRPVGSGKRVVKRGRPRKYLFGPPSRKRKTYRSSIYSKNVPHNTNNVNINARGCSISATALFFAFLLVLFSIIPIFRCIIPIILGISLLVYVEEYCKKSWGLPSGRWSKPVSIGWTILTTFAMLIGFVLVLLIQASVLPFVAIIILALVYAALSFLILRKKHTKAKERQYENENI